MKKSELKSYIKETIIAELGGAVNLAKSTNPADIKKYTAQGIDVNLKENEDSTELYAVILKGGSIGDKNNKPIKTFNTPEEAKEFAKRRNQQLSPGEKSYYKMSYNVIKLPKNLNEEEEDDEEKLDKKAQAAAKKGGGKVGKLQRVTAQLKELEKEMKELVGKWKKAEGKEKDTLLNKLKEKTKVKKELEALENKLADAIV